MSQENLYQFKYTTYDSASELGEDDRKLLQHAREAIASAYAPYSLFNVGAAAKLTNGEIISGGNQENASFPAGLCAEGVVMAIAAAQFPGVAIECIAISYSSEDADSDHPIAPCGICRQSLQEFSERTGAPIKLIMGGMDGSVITVDDASALLPFAFKF